MNNKKKSTDFNMQHWLLVWTLTTVIAVLVVYIVNNPSAVIEVKQAAPVVMQDGQ
jgi:hypothetical protein